MSRYLAAVLVAARAARARPPSILFLMPDQWRHDWDTRLDELDVPNLRSLAADGTRFEQAYVQAVVCAPSRSCMASLRDYDACGVATNAANDYDVEIPTYFSALQDAGYHTMSTGKDDLTKASALGYLLNHSTRNASDTYHAKELGFSDSIRYSGKNDVISTYPEPHEAYGYMLNASTVQLDNGTTVNAYAAHAACHGKAGVDPTLCDAASFPQNLYEDDWTAQNAVTLLDRAPADRPFMLWVSFPGPHPPFATTAAMHASTVNRTWPLAVDEQKTPRRAQCEDAGGGPGKPRTRCNYAAEIENLDRLFGTVLDAATKRDPNIIACAFSDHGEMLDDHDDQDKSKPWQGAVAVPLICAGPGISRNRTVAAPAAIYDLGATALDWAGATQPPNTTACSMRGLLEGEDESKRNRTIVLSGLRETSWNEPDPRFDFRLAVGAFGNTTYKYVCCSGICPGSPSTAPLPDADNYTRALYDTVADPFDMTDVKNVYPDVAETLRAALPVAHGFDCVAAPGR
mmetsp:Transcript_23758/g.74238  ORF Transcript_23758/g.74238 Transcript_23758/m.74238 type:complete len:515 (-) Transcript_23758:28-1572(-)